MTVEVRHSGDLTNQVDYKVVDQSSIVERLRLYDEIEAKQYKFMFFSRLSTLAEALTGAVGAGILFRNGDLDKLIPAIIVTVGAVALTRLVESNTLNASDGDKAWLLRDGVPMLDPELARPESVNEGEGLALGRALGD
jgi:hypothetical protein